MKHIKSLYILLSLLVFLSCKQSASSGKDNLNSQSWKTLADNSYSISYPNTWTINKSGEMGMSFILLSQASSQQDRYRENVNLLIQNLPPQQIDLDAYVNISENQISTMITNGNLLVSERRQSGGKEYHRVLYTGDQDNYKLKFEQHYYVEGNMAYVLTLTCEQDQYEKYKKTGRKILNSFRF